MKYTIDKREHVAILSLQEENLNSLNAPSLKSELVILSNEGVPHLILDLSNTKYVDSSGLSAILAANRIWSATNGVFVLTGIQHPSVRKLVEISRLQSVITIVPAAEEGVHLIQQAIAAADEEDAEA